VYNPATGEVARQVAFASGAVVDAAVEAAAKAGRGWGATSLTRRTQVLFAFREILNARKADLAAIITSEHGKVRSDALGEVSRGLEVDEFACGIRHLLKGGSPARSPRRRRLLDPAAGSVWSAVISPFNFPAMVPLWFVPIADRGRQRCESSSRGEKDPSGLRSSSPSAGGRPAWPDGVFSVVHGDKEAVDGLAHARRREGRVLRRPRRRSRATSTRPATAHGKRVQALGGAKNPHGGPPRRRPGPRRRLRRQRRLRLGGERCMAISGRGGSDPNRRHAWSPRSPERMAGLRTGDGAPTVEPAWYAGHVGHPDKVAGYSDAGV
jgi:malonate-semialdehyde dehydrogenase (acetylating)/methylmalonate-semialdehyde dehydrogenase